VLWLSISLCLYCRVGHVARHFLPDDALQRSLILCSALLQHAFCLDGARRASLYDRIFALTLAFYAEREEPPGTERARAVYMPLQTHFVAIAPTDARDLPRDYKTLVGFAGGGIALAGFATAVEGIHVWPPHISICCSPSLDSSGNARIERDRYDLVSRGPGVVLFFIPGGRSGWALQSSLHAPVRGLGARAGLVESAVAGKTARILIWATTLTWTLLLNLYVRWKILLLVVLSVIVTAGVLRHFPEKRFYRCSCSSGYSSPRFPGSPHPSHNVQDSKL